MKAFPAMRWSWWTSAVSRRIGLIMSVSLLLTAALAIVSLRGLAALSAQLGVTVTQQEHAAVLVGQMLESSRQLSDSARRAAAATTPEERTAALADLDAAKKALGERVDRISAELEDAPELQAALRDGFSSFVISAVKASRLMQANRQADAERELLISFDPKLLAYVLMTISGVSQNTDKSVRAVAASGHATYDRTLKLLIPILLAVTIAAIMSLWLMRRTVVRPVRRVARAAELLAAGRFDVDLTTHAQDECGDMLRAMGVLRQQLSSLIDTISSASHSVACAADALADNNEEISGRTTAQAHAFRSASQALQSLNAMAQQSATSASAVNRDMQSAFSVAQQGKAVIEEVVSTMQATAEASRRIADTVGMIDEIAFKTNILALNAAVEAARAGEHGRSFAVVAAEVRELAGKSATAAKEIESLIADSNLTVATSSKLAAEAGVAIENIVRQVQTATSHMAEISRASQEQSRKADEVTSAMREIDAGTQHNADMVSQTAASTQALRGEAQNLIASVAGFVDEQKPQPEAQQEWQDQAA